MTTERTIEHLARLAAAYGHKLDRETAQAYVQHLAPLADEQAFAQAIDDCIVTETFFPRIATLHDAYNVVREQKRRDDKPLEITAAEIERLPIPDQVKQWAIGNDIGQTPHASLIQGLERTTRGRCDDCREVTLSKRYRYARLELCAGCAAHRIRAKALVA